MSGNFRSSLRRCVDLPQASHYTLHDAHVPLACLLRENGEGLSLDADIDSLVNVDVEVEGGCIKAIRPTSMASKAAVPSGGSTCNLRGSMVLPTFVDLHTHIDKSHTCERSRNPTGCLSGADRSTDADAQFWNAEDVYRRMDFSIKSCYAHGTSALRTHLINMTPIQLELTWPTFTAIRKKWAGKVELQGVSLVALSYFRDQEAARKLADTVAEHGGIIGACVCCAEIGGDPSDDWTTCESDRGELLDRIFTLAKERDLDLDFHVDENGNEAAKGLLYISEHAIKHSYQGRVVCGHCCSLASQPPKELERILTAAKQAGVTIVSLPLVNQWTQDRDREGQRTPRWRGVTLAHEIRAAGIPFALASDNSRDQFFAYGDLDMLEVFNQGCRICHLDRPYDSWSQSVTSIPAAAMKLPGHCSLSIGGPADFIIFRGRKYSELLSRPQYDRVVVRNGEMLEAVPPDYRELDYVPAEFRYALPRAPTANGALPLPRHSSGVLSDPLNKTASGPFSSFSQDAFKKAVEDEVQQRMTVLRRRYKMDGAEITTRQFLLWLLGAALITLATLWLAGAIPFSFDNSLAPEDASFPVMEL